MCTSRTVVIAVSFFTNTLLMALPATAQVLQGEPGAPATREFPDSRVLPIPTPTVDKLAQLGLRYTQMHNTALCSPTRAALLTGRNHHVAGFGNIAEASLGYPGYDTVTGPDAEHGAMTLKLNGYSTAWFGKNHNVPIWTAAPTGPFDQFPIGHGYDYFYGFVGGDTSQWEPGSLYRNTTPIHPYVGQTGEWNLITAMADDAIAYINQNTSNNPDRPWFIHYAPGATHAPHHPTKEWVDKIEAMHLFDEGWNKLTERIFENQKKLGVIPPNAKLPEWPDFLPKWESLSDDQKKLYLKQINTWAAYMAYSDHEIGRVIDTVEKLGQMDNTLIIYVLGDNGMSALVMNGTPNEVAYFNGFTFTVDQMLPMIPAWGTDMTYPHFAVPWAFAMDTPYRWVKQIASHLGGTRTGMVVTWPKRITDAGGIRNQFHHVVDVVSTILDAVGIPQPTMINGIGQRPMDGVSMVYTWDKANAAAPSTRKTQYFEIFGNRAIYHDGWMAVTNPPVTTWEGVTAAAPVDVMNGYMWSLYNLTEDPTETNDLAAKEPERLRAMQELWIIEATRNNVFPLNNSKLPVFTVERPGPAAGRTKFEYFVPQTGTQLAVAPQIINRSFTISAEIDVPQGGGSGMLLTQGGRFSGYGLYLTKDGKPTFLFNMLDGERPKWQAPQALSPGKHTIVFDWKMEPKGTIVGRGGTGTLVVDGKEVAKQSLPKTQPMIWMWDETFDIGSDTGTSVNDADYASPFPFTGKIGKITVDLGATTATPEAVRALMIELSKKRDR